VSLPFPRPELSNQLLEAIRRRDAAATARLTRQWVHRHGVVSLGDFRLGTVIPQEGPEAANWLDDQLEGGASAPAPTAPRAQAATAPEPYHFTEPPGPPPAVESAFAALEAAFLSPSLLPSEEEPIQAPTPTVPFLPGAALLSSLPASTLPAPAPSTLADLRSWLSGGPQHRRAG
jgi:hypothetical protein